MHLFQHNILIPIRTSIEKIEEENKIKIKKKKEEIHERK